MKTIPILTDAQKTCNNYLIIKKKPITQERLLRNMFQKIIKQTYLLQGNNSKKIKLKIMILL